MGDYDGVRFCQRCNARLKSERDFMEGECLYCRTVPHGAGDGRAARITAIEALVAEVERLRLELEFQHSDWATDIDEGAH